MLYGEKLIKLLDNKFSTENRGIGLEGFYSSLCFKDTL